MGYKQRIHLDRAYERKPSFDSETMTWSQPPKELDYDQYHEPIYKSMTYDPLVALAITRIAEKNLSSINFDSALDNIFNVGPNTKYPIRRDNIRVLEHHSYQRNLMERPIRIFFFPNMYSHGCHCIGYYTRKLPSQQLCSAVFTPCTDADIAATHLATGDLIEDGP